MWVFIHEHLQFRGKQGKGLAISFSSLYYFHLLRSQLDISRASTAHTTHLCKKLAAGIEPGTFGFQAEVTNL